MIAVILAFSLPAAIIPPGPLPPPPDLHLVVESQFNYLSSIRTTTTELWMSPGKRMTKIGDQLTIRREDLGIRWRVDLKAGTYTEEKIEPPAPPPPEKEDIHTVGQGYHNPEFEWTVAAGGEKSTLFGRPCRQFTAAGDSDYAESSVTFRVCEPIPGITYQVNDATLAHMRNPSAQKMVEQTAAKNANGWVLAIEEMQEPPVAPKMTTTVSVKTFEATPAPSGTFELPANLKKAGR